MCLYTIYTVCMGFICILMQVSQEGTDISAAEISAGWIGVSGSSWNTTDFCLGSGFHCSVDFISTDVILRDRSPQNEKLMHLLSLMLFKPVCKREFWKIFMDIFHTVVHIEHGWLIYKKDNLKNGPYNSWSMTWSIWCFWSLIEIELFSSFFLNYYVVSGLK